MMNSDGETQPPGVRYLAAVAAGHVAQAPLLGSRAPRIEACYPAIVESDGFVVNKFSTAPEGDVGLLTASGTAMTFAPDRTARRSGR